MPSVNYILNTDNTSAYKRFFRAAAEGGWNMLLNYLCNARQSRMQRGSGFGNIHAPRYSAVIPLEAFTEMQMGAGERCPKDPKDPKVQEVTPTEQAVQIARSELRNEEDSQPPSIKRARPKRRAQSASKREAGRSSTKSSKTSKKRKRGRENTPPLFQSDKKVRRRRAK